MRAQRPGIVWIAGHPRHLMLVGFIGGLLGSTSPPASLGCGAIAALGLLWLAGRQVLCLALGVLVAIVAGTLLGGIRLDGIDRSSLRKLSGHSAALRGYVVRRERASFGTPRLRLRVTDAGPSGSPAQRVSELVQVRTAPGAHSRVPAQMRAATVGDQLELVGRLDPVRSGRARDFDYGAYLRRGGIHMVMRAEAARVTGAKRGGLAGVVDTFRRNAERGLEAGLRPGTAALARGMVLGQDEGIAAPMSEDFRRSGLAHVLAVSGQNVALLGLLAWPLLGLAGLGRNARLAAILGLIGVYVPLTGGGPSILRAGVMGAAATAAALAGRPASRWYPLLLAAAVTLALDPRAWRDLSWQLSFAAVVGISCAGAPLARVLRRLPQPLRAGAALTVAATLATAPLMAFHFGAVSLVGLPANLIALPAVAPVMWLGMLSAAVAQLALWPAEILNALNAFLLGYVAAVAHWSARVPGAVWAVGLGSQLSLAIAYTLLVAGAVALRGRVEAGRETAPGVASRRRAAVALLAICAAALVWTSISAPARAPRHLTVTFLDVGQGDATLIQVPPGGAVLVDGGPPGAGLVEMLRKRGVRRLDVVVLTHAQLDHQGGLAELFESIPVGVLLDGGWGSGSRQHRRIVALARARSTRVVRGHAGQALSIGRLRLRVLSPTLASAREPIDEAEDPNLGALVVMASYGWLDIFMPADAESEVTAALPLRPVELLKVAHHGSEDEGLPDLLERLRPWAAVIEVGAGNRHGHPHPRTLAALGAGVPRVLRTDRDGEVAISLVGDQLRLSSAGGDQPRE